MKKIVGSLYLAGIDCSKCIKYTTIKRCNFPATLKRTVLRSWDPREIERQTPLEGERERERIFIGKHFATVSRCGKNLANKFIEVVGWQ